MTVAAARHRPLFGTALARSGAGLLCHMLSAHPGAMLARNPFLENFKAFRDAVVVDADDAALRAYAPAGAALSDYYCTRAGVRLLDTVLAADLDLPVPEGAWRQLETRLAARAALECADLAPHVGALRAGSHRELCDQILAVIATVRGCAPGSWVGFQEPWIVDFFPALARAYEHARFIILLRDPRAIVTSLKGITATEPGQVAQVLSYARHWRKYAALATMFCAPDGVLGRLMAERVLVLRYEDLTADPAAQMARVCAFLDLPFDPATTDPARFHDYNTGRPFRGNSSFGEVGHRIDADAGQRWRRQAAPDLVAAVEWLCGPDMALWGYAVDGQHDRTREAVRYLAEDARRPSAWRSDSGDLQHDLGCELFRRHALALPAELLDDATIRRSFLFPEIHAALAGASIAPVAPGASMAPVAPAQRGPEGA